MIIIEKDRHSKNKKPFYQANIDLNNFYLNSELNNEKNTFISLGDWYDSSIPTPEEIDITERFFTESKFREIILLGGNHDFSNSLKSYSILPLRNNPRVTIITEPCVRAIEGKTFAFLPFLENDMKETYTSLKDHFINTDYILYHFEDESISFSKKKVGIDISYLKGKRIGGHIHTSQKNYELGMPINSNVVEKQQQNNVLCISSKEEYFVLPTFVDYYSVEYGEDLHTVTAKYPIWDILNAPTKKQAHKFYKDKYPEIQIRDVQVKDTKKEAIKNQLCTSTIVEFFTDYMKDRDDIKDWARSRLKTLVQTR